jgi:hypothetical protein
MYAYARDELESVPGFWSWPLFTGLNGADIDQKRNHARIAIALGFVSALVIPFTSEETFFYNLLILFSSVKLAIFAFILPLSIKVAKFESLFDDLKKEVWDLVSLKSHENEVQ